METARIALVAALWLTGVPALAAGVYKWVDQDGNVYFGDRPQAPEDAEQVRLRQAPAPAPAAVPSPRHSRIGEVMEQERLQRKQDREERRAEREKRQRNCNLARDRLRRFTSAGYIYDLDEAGNRRVLDDDERQTAEQRARDAVSKWCE